MEIYEILSQIMEERNLKVAEVARLCDLPDGTVRGIIKREQKDIALKVALKLSKGLGVSIEYLNGMPERKKSSEELKQEKFKKYEHIIDKYRFISTHSPDGAVVVDTVLDREYAIAEKLREQKEQLEKVQRMDMEVSEEIVPTRLWAYYGKIAAAGTSVEFSDMIAGTKEYPINEMNQNADYVIGVNGDSMEPEYYDGDIVFVEKTTHVSIGDVGIFQKDNNIYIKKAGENGLVSLKAGYPIITSEDGVRVLGKVLGKAE